MPDFERDYIPFWDNADDPTLWDVVRIAGKLFPGTVRVSGDGVKRKVDVKKSKGKDGAKLKDEGEEAGDITVEFRIYDAEQWRDLQGLWPTINPRKKGGKRTPVTIDYPTLRLLNIKSIYVYHIPVPAFDYTNKWLNVTLKAVEYAETPKILSSGAGSPGNKPQSVAVDAVAAAIAEAAALAGNDAETANPSDALAQGLSDQGNALCNAFSFGFACQPETDDATNRE